jgi:GT2 family glycosyltransferase
MKASIIIPSYNAKERLYYNLQSLNMLEYSREDFEVIVVDNDSTDGTDEMLSSINTNYILNSFYINKNMGRAFARNYGVKEAKGNILIFLDSDMMVEKTFLAKHIEAHEACNTVVCGQSWRRVYSFYYEDFKGYLKRNLIKQLSEKGILKVGGLIDKQALISEAEIKNERYFEISFNLSKMYEAEKELLEKYGENLDGFYFPWSILVTNNCSIEKELFDQVGGFDNSFISWGCEDLDLGYRLYKNGCKFIKQNEIKSVHQEHPINFLDNGVENILYFTKKYDNIDLLLFYYGYLIKVDKNTANDIMKEIDRSNRIEYHDILETYRRLLVALRNKKFNYNDRDNDWFHEIKKLKVDIALQKDELKSMLRTIEIEDSLPNFLYTFKLLIAKVFNNRLENIQ